ncbi:RES family NAD+ phosphorylase [Candidatus Poriferisodalis sp.]|uniref:RES family NAD+ phosphorylase n=1 Tax=Candidatus Poriferisodalis sp. TaxID=3101277 RepID=UPI003B51F0B2
MTCPDPASCRVLHPDAPVALRPLAIPAETTWFNVSRREGVFNPSGDGDSRFAPLFTLDAQAVPYVYLAQNPIGALLETALHDVWGTTSAVQRVDLSGRCLRRLTCMTDLRVVDLRNHQLVRCQLEREELVSSPSEHYACTRRWADHHARSEIEGEPITGLIWHSRQMEVAAAHARIPMQVLLSSVEQAAHTAVIYDTAGEGDRHFDVSIEYDDLGTGAGLELVGELCTDLGLCIEY